MSSERRFAVYILATRKDGPLYVGMTSHLTKRIAEHRAHAVRGFTERYNVDRLVYVEFHETAEAAISREKRLKRWRREWKADLIEGENPDWLDRSGEIVG